jgi:hypothetical protein
MSKTEVCQYGNCANEIIRVRVSDKLMGDRPVFCCGEHAALFLLNRSLRCSNGRTGSTLVADAQRLLANHMAPPRVYPSAEED